MQAAQPPSLGLDGRSLDALRTEAARNPKAAARQAAVQFESLFMQMVMKSMREATPKAEGDETTGTLTGMLDAQLARQFAGRPNGLAETIERQLTRHMRELPAVSPENLSLMQPAAAGSGAAAGARGSAAGAAAGGATGGVAGGVGGAAAAPLGTRQADFIRRMAPHAQAAERATGVPAAFILGQAALESGWGRSEPRNADGTPSFNLFGIKAGASTGPVAQAMTTEYLGGQPVRQSERFRSYGSYAAAFEDYARLIGGSARYAPVVRSASTVEAFAGGMQRAGYATDPQYAAKLSRTINQALALQRAQG